MGSKILSVRACSWCRRGSPLDVGPGIFRDVDSDQTYGIPVCGGCGGLGHEMDDPDFKESCGRILQLRMAYCPTSGLPVVSPGVRLKALLELEERVKALYKEFGSGQNCYAKRISEGVLRSRIAQEREEIEKLVRRFEGPPPEGTEPEIVAPFRAAMIAAVRGELDEAERHFQELLELKPESSEVRYDYASFVAHYRRDLEGALPHFQAACEMAPRKALHHVQTAYCLRRLGHVAAAREYMKHAADCPDLETLPPVEVLLVRAAQSGASEIDA